MSLRALVTALALIEALVLRVLVGQAHATYGLPARTIPGHLTLGAATDANAARL